MMMADALQPPQPQPQPQPQPGTDRVPSLLMLCCAKIAQAALEYDSMEAVADDLVMFICERAAPLQLAHLDTLFADAREQYHETNVMNWERLCRERWAADELAAVRAECLYDERRPTYWKSVFLTMSLREAVHATADLPSADTERLVRLAAEHISLLSVRRVSLSMLRLLGEQVTRLRRLNLEGCDLRAPGCATAVSALLYRNPHLTSCSLARTRLGESAEAREVVHAVRDHPALLFANLSWCELNATVAQWLAEALPRCAALRCLDVRWNPFLRAGRQTLQRALAGLQQRRVRVLLI